MGAVEVHVARPLAPVDALGIAPDDPLVRMALAQGRPLTTDGAGERRGAAPPRPPMRRLTIAAALIAVGCQPPVSDYTNAREACWAEVERWHPGRWADETARLIGAGCAEALGATIGMDWESFGFTPQTLQDSPTGALVLVGLLDLLADEQDSAQDVWNDPDLPQFVYEELSRAQVAPDAPRAELMFAMIRASLFVSDYADAIPGQPKGAAAYYEQEHRGTFTPLMLQWGPELSGFDPPASAAGAIVHEAAHRIYGGHVPCSHDPEQDCDLSREGAYGMHIWTLAGWITRYGSDYTVSMCSAVYEELSKRCGDQIDGEDKLEWAPCLVECP
jgi:hypothetical protein